MEEKHKMEVFVVNKHMETICDIIKGDVELYFIILSIITDTYLKDAKNQELIKRKFDEIRQQLFEFVKQHRDFILIHRSLFKVDTKIMAHLNFGCLGNAEKFIDFETMIKFVVESNEINRNNLCVENFLDVSYEPLGYVKFVEQLYRKPVSQITKEDLVNFENIAYLDDQKWKHTKCSHIDLRNKMYRRLMDFKFNRVPTERTEELSFTFDESTEHIVADKECVICKEEYENGQELCRMPCNHFFHRHCIEKWFKPLTVDAENIRNEVTHGNADSESSLAESSNDSEEEYEEITENYTEEDEVIMDDFDSSLFSVSDSDSTSSYYYVSDDSVESDIEIPEYDLEDDDIPEYDTEEDDIPEYDIEENDIPDYDIEEDDIPEYDIEEDVPDTRKFQCPICRHNCC